MQNETFSITTHEELAARADEILSSLQSRQGAKVLALSGDLGAGKTTFVQQLGRLLGIEESITSPTFVILRQYDCQHPTWHKLFHMDAYRLEAEEELGPLGFSELIKEPATLFCIEWAEQIKNALPADTLYLHFELHTDQSRTITCSQTLIT